MTQPDRVLNIRAKVFKNNSCACVKNTTSNYRFMHSLFFHNYREKLYNDPANHACARMQRECVSVSVSVSGVV